MRSRGVHEMCVLHPKFNTRFRSSVSHTEPCFVNQSGLFGLNTRRRQREHTFGQQMVISLPAMRRSLWQGRSMTRWESISFEGKACLDKSALFWVHLRAQHDLKRHYCYDNSNKACVCLDRRSPLVVGVVDVNSATLLGSPGRVSSR